MISSILLHIRRQFFALMRRLTIRGVAKFKPLLQLTASHALVFCKHGFFLVNKNDYYIAGALISYGEYSEAEYELMSQMLFKDGDIIEVGANIGALSVPLARIADAKEKKLYCFEPQRIVFQNLCANIFVNELKNVFAFNFAVGSERTTVTCSPCDYDQIGNFGGVSIDLEERDCLPRSDSVDMIVLDDFFGDKKISFIKVDVEGFEFNVLKGACNIINKNRPLIQVEGDRSSVVDEVSGLLLSLNYKLYWSKPPLFNSNNYNNRKDDFTGGVVSMNIVAIPSELNLKVVNLDEFVSVPSA